MAQFNLDPRRIAATLIGLDALRSELQGKVDESIVHRVDAAAKELKEAHEALSHQKHYFEVPEDYRPPQGTCGGSQSK